jgi:hypothetical protein
MESNTPTNADLVRSIGAPIFEGRGWLKFLGVLMILYGVLAALTIVGILFAWLPIWQGVLLFQAGSLAEQSSLSGDAAHLTASLGKLKVYFMIMGILALLGIAVTILFMSLGLMGMLAGLAQNL